MTEDTFISPEVSATKFFLRELLLFFIEKRRAVFGDADFVFTVEEFQDFIKGKNFARVMGDDINAENVHAHLKNCKELKKRNRDLLIINPQTPILTYTKLSANGGSQRFNIKDCQTEYIKNALRDIDIALSINDWSVEGKKRVAENKRSIFAETKDRELSFHGKITTRPLTTKERALFEALNAIFGEKCDYKIMFSKYKKMAGPGNNLASEYRTAPQKKSFVNDGVQELKKRMYEISGNPNTIETLPGRNSEYRLIY